jgi:hypothetical protein
VVQKGAGGLGLATCELRLPGRAKRLLGFLIPGRMDRIIRRHRRWRALAGRLSIRREENQRSLWIAITTCTAMAGAILAERMAWRRLVRYLPRNPHDAQNKLLYLMALSIGGDTKFTRQEFDQITATLRDFEAELKALLQPRP